MKKTAIIIGATGLTGNLILNKLLNDKRYVTIKVFSRTKLKRNHAKLLQKSGNLLDLKNFKDDFYADEVYCCIGTTAKKTPDKEIYKKIDYGIPLATANLCKSNGILTLVIVSALGANSKSTIFYNRIKGEMERDVGLVNVENTYFLRPSLIVGNRNERRWGESFAKYAFTLFQFLLIGKLKKYKAVHAKKIAKKMIEVANTYPENQFILSDEIQNTQV